MPATAGGKFIYKPYSDGALNPGGLSVVLPYEAESAQDVRIVDAEGNTLEVLKKSGKGSEGVKFYTSTPGGAFGQNVKVLVDGKEFAIPNAGQRYEGAYAGDGVLAAVNKGASTAPGGMFAPTAFGAGASPAYLGGQFPTYIPSVFQPVPGIDVPFADPQQFAEQYGQFATDKILENFEQGTTLGLKQLQTELQGLQEFAPAAAALKRKELAADNVFNQTQRTEQLRGTLPGVLNNLSAQTDRAGVLATGRLPSAIEDEALSVAARSRAADTASTRGFGDNSTLARRTSDLMSAEQRLQISQYGDQLIQTNAQVRAGLELAPTAYSDAGTQIRVMPEIGAGRAAATYSQTLNEANTLTAAQALSSTVNQNQFQATLSNNINQFNSSNALQNSQFNTQNQFSAGLGLFNYNQGYAANLAGLQTAEINQTRADAIRDKLTQIYEQSKGSAQNRETIKQVLDVLGKIPGLSDIVSDVVDSFEGDVESTDSNTSTQTSEEVITTTNTPTEEVPADEEFTAADEIGYDFGVSASEYNQAMGS